MFTKGNKLSKGGGRPKGSVGIATHEARGLREYIKDEGKDRFIEEMMKLEGKDYCDVYTKVVGIAYGKKTEVDVNIQVKQVQAFQFVDKAKVIDIVEEEEQF